MTQYIPSFNPSEFELRDYTASWLSPDQQTAVNLVENRVNEQLDFLAQMLGWSGPNYWTNLPTTVSEKRQLLGGTFGVYNSYVIPRIYEIRNWNETIVVDKLPFIKPGQNVYVESVDLGREEYQIQDVKTDGDKYIVSLGPLPSSFYDQIANNVPLKVDIPSSRPAPFYRPTVGASGDGNFICGITSNGLTLYPSWDTKRQFPYKFPILFAGSTYYFNQPVYLSFNQPLTVDLQPQYDANLQLWFISIPSAITLDVSSIDAFLVWTYADSATPVDALLTIKIQTWQDPSDWDSKDVIQNFTGSWGNKGGPLPFNLSFDSLSIHGFNEQNSLYLGAVEPTIDFNQIVDLIYAQKSLISLTAPGNPDLDGFWWNPDNGILSARQNIFDACSPWVDIDYPKPAISRLTPLVIYPDVATFIANSGTLPLNTLTQIENITGLGIPENVLGVQGTLLAPGSLILVKLDSSPYWTPVEFGYTSVGSFDTDALMLPYKIPVRLYNSSGLTPSGSNYLIKNLQINITGDYEVVLTKFYNNRTWELSVDTNLKYIANSSLFGSYQAGEMWWDFSNPVPETRAAAIYVSSPSAIVSLAAINPGVDLDDGTYLNVKLLTTNSGGGGGATADITVAGNTVLSVAINNPGNLYQQGDVLVPDPVLYPSIVGSVFTVTAALADAWVQVNSHSTGSTPAPSLNMGVILFYCDGTLLQDGISYSTENYIITYTSNLITGKYEFVYQPATLIGKTKFPKITISDSLTTAFTADVTNIVFSGITYYMSPNVYDAETTLRLWKSQDLQEAETVAHLAEKNYINPLIADLNNGPGAENWERYFVRLPLDYGRNEMNWQKTALICQDFAYWGSSIEPEKMNCPPEAGEPLIYEELFLYNQPIPDYAYVYAESYLYSNIGYYDVTTSENYANAGIFPTFDVEFDEFTEANLTNYDPLHNRLADVTSPINQGYGDWEGVYVNINPCKTLTGFLTNDLLSGAVEPILPPVWDASIYKFAPTCQNNPESYSVDANHYKIGYAYFVADASAAEEGFFDPQQEAAWRKPVSQPKTLYLVAQ
jgi:hypothetical protein